MSFSVSRIAINISLGLIMLCLGACSSASEAEPPTEKNKAISVDIATATLSKGDSGVDYIGTTAPIQSVTIQAQTQGQLLKLNYEVGDRIQTGQVIAELDSDILAASVDQARAQREAQISEVASAQRRVSEVKTRVEQAKVELAQAQSNIIQLKNAWKSQVENARLEAEQTAKDAQRQTELLKSGVTSKQQAEQAKTLAQRAQQTLLNEQANAKQELEQASSEIDSREQLLKAAQAQVAIEQKAVEAADRRTTAQQSVLSQASKEQSLSSIKAPFSGLVMDKQTEAGTFLQTGQDIITLGDFSQVKVLSQISEKQLGNLKVGQAVQLKLDAFESETFTGKIQRISPLADANSRLVPVEIVMPNPQGKIGAGLLARVSLGNSNTAQLTVPETALQKELPKPESEGKPDAAKGKKRGFSAQRKQQEAFKAGEKAYVFVVSQGESPKVRARQVILGDRVDGQVEIRSGLQPNERYVQRSSRPLQDGITVNVSALSLTEGS